MLDSGTSNALTHESSFRPNKRAQAKFQTRCRIVAAAEQLIMERGFEAATMRDIAAAADVSTGAVFASFTDKHDLFEAVMVASTEQVARRVTAMRAESEGPVLQQLLDIQRELYAFYLARLPLVRAFIAQMWARVGVGELLERSARKPARDVFEAVLLSGVRSGELSEALDVEQASDVLWDCYLCNYRGAVFDQWDLDAVMARAKVQVEQLLCGHLRG